MATSIDNLNIYNHNGMGNPHPQYSNEGIRVSAYEGATNNPYFPLLDIKMSNSATGNSLWRLYYGFKMTDQASDSDYSLVSVSAVHTVNYANSLKNLVKKSVVIQDPDESSHGIVFDYEVYYADNGDGTFNLKSYIHLGGNYKQLVILSPWVYAPIKSAIDNREYLPLNSRIAIEEQTGFFFDKVNNQPFISASDFASQTSGMTKVTNQQ